MDGAEAHDTVRILRHISDERHHSRSAAEAITAFLLLRIGPHTGLRQKNLCELLLCKRSAHSAAERRLEGMKRGELRWGTQDQGREILIPSVAFKNANSSFFGAKLFRLILPDLGRLYGDDRGLGRPAQGAAHRRGRRSEGLLRQDGKDD